MAIGSEVEHWDVVIVGAGIAGLAAVRMTSASGSSDFSLTTPRRQSLSVKIAAVF